ncbi:xanthine dehydrogenase family protein molybdopterin-binding subunit [Nonomuraea diastatica]|uniref:Xanthine dehydrogenase family protein molybdopterin-binding subunit n=1 Tax=Nonomuraea diastatica TaxID=1848329 RepID=A0A4V2YG51_9ACTN|nr:xanthine dehydrogenase family protein molybdopterin-binding subunit [Nonomuraea diastatica]TDD25697.1 xanthine dehydrogenase family protein molybdopterin-binding subunit [Nonomuraea diastatica]
MTPRVAGPRVDGWDKVTGAARYAADHSFDGPVHCWPVSSTIAKGRVVSIDTSAALAVPGVVAVLWHANAPRLHTPTADPMSAVLVKPAELAVLQSDGVAYHGQLVAAVLADSLEAARHAAGLLVVEYEQLPHDAELRPGARLRVAPPSPGLDPPEQTIGNPAAALAGAEVTIDARYTTPAEHHNPIEPHATVAAWQDGGVVLYDANQGAHLIQGVIAGMFDLPRDRVRVVSAHVGGGFGAKGPQAVAVLAVMATRMLGRPVKVTLSRQQMFALVGYRSPTVQRVRLGADRAGRLAAVIHEVVAQTSAIHDFCEPAAVLTRTMYAAPHRHTTHRLARLDVPTPFMLRAPGAAPGMFALESAVDELAVVCGLDPVELRIRNEPAADPDTGLPYSSRNLVRCLREGARAFGWRPPPRRDGHRLVGSGVAASAHPSHTFPSTAQLRLHPDGRCTVALGATDIGNGARTVLTAITAEAMAMPPERIDVLIGDSSLPLAAPAGASAGTASWGSAIVDAARRLRAQLTELGDRPLPPDGLTALGQTLGDLAGTPTGAQTAKYAFGAQFAEVCVDIDSGEVRVTRLLGVFAAGKILSPHTARSQLLGGMTMGLSMALHEESVLDSRFGDFVNGDLAGYHIATCADVPDIEVGWIDETDDQVNALGAKGIGELGIVGTAAAIANAVHHATGIRVRDLPIHPHRILEGRP